MSPSLAELSAFSLFWLIFANVFEPENQGLVFGRCFVHNNT